MGYYTEEIMNWNIDRDNTDYNTSLEYSMLEEELEEYSDAITTTDIVAQADALGDLIAVATGSLLKLCNGDKDKVYGIMLAITAANNTKSSTKNAQGKITKPKDFVGPEDMIERVLLDG